jgi:hypothetical protein
MWREIIYKVYGKHTTKLIIVRIFVILKIMRAQKQLLLKTIQHILITLQPFFFFQKSTVAARCHFHFHTSPNKSSTVAANILSQPDILPYIVQSC